MGAGKSAVGRALARLLRYDFVDTDNDIEKHAGVDIPFIFEKEGEEGFREREYRSLIGLSEDPHRVIATGGGCVLAEKNREIMRERGTVVYLEASVDQLYERIRCSTHRPLINTQNPRQMLQDIVDKRLPIYTELAHLTVNTDRRRVRHVAHDIQRRLGPTHGHREDLGHS